MSHYDFSHSVDRADCRSEKWSRKNIAQVCGNEDALPFWVADMDLRACDEITSALEEENRRAVYGYRENSRLTENFISFMKARHSTDLREENIAASQGMLHSIALALNLFLSVSPLCLITSLSNHGFLVPYVAIICHLQAVVNIFLTRLWHHPLYILLCA